MSALGQTRSFGDVRSTSGLPPRADLRASSPQVLEVPIPDLCTHFFGRGCRTHKPRFTRLHPGKMGALWQTTPPARLVRATALARAPSPVAPNRRYPTVGSEGHDSFPVFKGQNTRRPRSEGLPHG